MLNRKQRPDRDKNREQQNPQIDCEVERERKQLRPNITQGRQPAPEARSSRKRNGDSARGPQKGQDRVLAENLAANSRAGSPDGKPDRNFPFAQCGAGEQKTSDICARDQEQQTRGGHQQIQRVRIMSAKRGNSPIQRIEGDSLFHLLRHELRGTLFHIAEIRPHGSPIKRQAFGFGPRAGKRRASAVRPVRTQLPRDENP
jgi:hypothetical protein